MKNDKNEHIATVKASINKAILVFGSQKKLADEANLTQGAISKYARGESLPTGVTANNLSEAVIKKGLKLLPKDFAPHIFKFSPNDTAPLQ